MISYRALYRKYRPQTFSEVVDQEHITRTLSNAVSASRISHAYLFTGPRGIGKTSIARIFAKAINCMNPINQEPCNECEICKSIMDGSNPDVIEIDAASRTKVDQMRETLEKVSFLPTMSKYKVYIIDEVHMLTVNSFNALLKTLEEPPKHVIFILCTTEVEKVIPTIRSRCQRFDFHLISKDSMIKRLKEVIVEERIKIENSAISLLAEAAEGGMRDALSLLDQVSSFSLNECITEDDVLEVTGKLSTEYLTFIALNILKGDSTLAINELDELIKKGKEVEKITQGLITFYKDILILKNTDKDINKVGYDSNEFMELKEKLSNENIYKYIEILTNTMNDFRFSINKRLYLELAFIKMCENGVKPIREVKEDTKVFVQEEKEEIDNPNVIFDNPFVNKEKEEKPIKPIITLEEAPIKEEFKEEKPVIEEPKKEEIKEETKDTSITDVGYDIDLVEKILNNFDKSFKEDLILKIDKAVKESKGSTLHKFALLMGDGNIVASSPSGFIISFQEVGYCNLIMKSDNKEGVKKFISTYIDKDLDFIALPFELWNKLSNEFVRKYKLNSTNKTQEYIKLTPIEFPGLKYSKTQEKEDKKKEDDVFQDIENLFGDILEIK